MSNVDRASLAVAIGTTKDALSDLRCGIRLTRDQIRMIGYLARIEVVDRHPEEPYDEFIQRVINKMEARLEKISETSPNGSDSTPSGDNQ